MTTATTEKVSKALAQAPELKKGLTLQSLIRTSEIRSRFKDMLGNRAGQYLSSIISATSSNNGLSACDPMAILAAGSIAASLDLPINPSLGFAHIVPYKKVAQFQIGWKGFVQLGMRSGQYLTMNATTVREGELKKRDRFTGRYEFDEAGKTSDKVIGYVFYFKLLNGYEKYVYWTKEECEAHGKRYSQSYQKGFGRWVEDFDGMSLKTVVKNGLSKWGILSTEMQKAMVYDQATVKADGTAEYIDAAATTDEEAPAAEPEAGPSAAAKDGKPYKITFELDHVQAGDLNGAPVWLIFTKDKAKIVTDDEGLASQATTLGKKGLRIAAHVFKDGPEIWAKDLTAA